MAETVKTAITIAETLGKTITAEESWSGQDWGSVGLGDDGWGGNSVGLGDDWSGDWSEVDVVVDLGDTGVEWLGGVAGRVGQWSGQTQTITTISWNGGGNTEEGSEDDLFKYTKT